MISQQWRCQLRKCLQMVIAVPAQYDQPAVALSAIGPITQQLTAAQEALTDGVAAAGDGVAYVTCKVSLLPHAHRSLCSKFP